MIDKVHNSLPNPETLSIKSAHVKPQLLPTNVYVNPNFKPQNPTVHINPNIYAKPLIHINPKIMYNIANSNQNQQNNVSTINTSTTKVSMDNNTKPAKRAIYVNPTLLKKLSSSKEKSKELAESKELISKESITTEPPVCSRLKPTKNINNQKISPKRVNNSSIVLLSRRKLVRVARSPKIMSKSFLVSQYKLSKSTELIGKKIDKTILQTKNKLLTNNALQSTNKSNLAKLYINKSNNNSKVTKYKIDRTMLKVKKISPSEKRKVM